MINLLLGITCLAMAVLFCHIIYACGYKKGCEETSNEYRGCLSQVRGMNASMAARLARLFAKNRTFKR